MFIVRPVLAGLLATVIALVVLSAPDWLNRPALAGQGAVITDEVLFEQGEVRVYAGPVPAWVQPLDLPAPDEVTSPIQNGLRLVALDEFASAVDAPPLHYAHQVIDVVSGVGVQAASIIVVPMNPAHDELIVHSIRTGPAGAMRERREMVAFSVVQAENLAELPGLTGQINLLIRIPGVRPGDRVEIQYSLFGQPGLVDHGRTLVLSGPGAQLDRLRVRARAPEGAGEASFGAYESPAREIRAGVETLTYHDGAYSPSQADPLIPAWHFPTTGAMVSTTPGWAEIAAWAEPFYEPQVTDQVAGIAAEIRAAHGSREAQIAAALRYVQREIRYFALLLGDGGYQPLSPDETLSLMEGDCKAKALLLISILDALGVEADAAMVNPMVGRGIDRLPASVYAFNHVIVTLEHDGLRYWFDPTAYEQSGTLDTLAQPDYGLALIAGPARSLIDMAVKYEAPLMRVSESYVLSGTRVGDRARAELELVFSGLWADNARLAVSSLGAEAFAASMAQGFAAKFAAVQELAPVVVTDDREANTYTLAFNWSVLPVNAAQTKAGTANPIFAQVETLPPVPAVAAGRESAVAAQYPHSVEHALRIQLPDGAPWPEIARLDETRENAAFRYAVVRSQTGPVIESRSRIEMLAAEVAPAELAEVNRDLAFVQQAMPIVLGLPGFAAQEVRVSMQTRAEPWGEAFGEVLAAR